MKLTLLLVFAFIGITHEQNQPGNLPTQPGAITIAPKLGAGFGKVIEIQGKIIDDTDTRRRAHLGKKLLQVQAVGGVNVKGNVWIELSFYPFSDVEIPKRGIQATLRGYETGGFRGIPQAAFGDIPLVATTPYTLESQFIVTKVLKPAPPVPQQARQAPSPTSP